MAKTERLATRVSKAARNMRKQPRQARSRETLHVIVEAAAQVLARKGWSGFTTNDVASTAGVSIGSVYQYFPNKLTLLDAIRHRHFRDILDVFDMPADDDRNLCNRVNQLIDGMVAAHHRCPGLHRVLMDEVPKPDAGSIEDQKFDLAYRERFRSFIAASTGLTDARHLEGTASVLSSAIEGMVHEAARKRLADARPMRDEIVDLVVSYLQQKRRNKDN